MINPALVPIILQLGASSIADDPDPIISRRISIMGNDSRRISIRGNDNRRISVLGNDGRRIRLKGN